MSTISKKNFYHPIKGAISPEALEESEALLILSSIPTLGPIKIRRLVKYFGAALTALTASQEDMLQAFPGDENLYHHISSWQNKDAWKSNLELIAKHNVDIIAYKDENYPKGLLSIRDFPLLLYSQGNKFPSNSKTIAIIGTRNASIYGMEMAKLFSKELAASGFIVISGLARGIDTAAHLGALQSGTTFAIIGSGLANVYPKENYALAKKISLSGALLSELPMQTPPDRQNFPQRNRIVSGLADAILLIEAPLKSGAMHTMHIAKAQNKRLFALPGRVDGENFCGNHALIKQGQAQLVESPQEIIKALLGIDATQKPLKQNFPGILLDKEEIELLRSLPIQEISLEEILLLTKMPIGRLNALLMSLLLKGAIKEYPGRIYKK